MPREFRSPVLVASKLAKQWTGAEKADEPTRPAPSTPMTVAATDVAAASWRRMQPADDLLVPVRLSTTTSARSRGDEPYAVAWCA
jgi:hypothetical protein